MESIVFGQNDVCDATSRVNLIGLINRIEIKLPLKQYLAMNNQAITEIDPMERPINIYKGELNKPSIKFVEEDSGSRLSKIVIPIEINGTMLTGIVDTGAEYTLLSTLGAQKIGLMDKIDRRTRDKIKGVAGVS